MAGDITLGSHTTYFGQNLTAYVLNGTIPESRVDDMGTVVPLPICIYLTNYSFQQPVSSPPGTS